MDQSKGYSKILVTQNHEYHMDDTHESSLAPLRKYDRKTGKLVSDSKKVQQELLELVLLKEYEWISHKLKDLETFLFKHQKIVLANAFYSQNLSKFKEIAIRIKEIDGAFNHALQDHLGFSLNQAELQELYRIIHRTEIKNHINM